MPPGSGFGGHSGGQKSARLVSLIVFVVLAAGAIGVVFFLPDKISKPVESTADPTPPLAASKAAPKNVVAPADVDPQSPANVPEAPAATMGATAEQPRVAPVAQTKEEATILLGRVLQQQARLENDGVRVWGGTLLKTSYPEALSLLAKANEDFDKQKFGTATDRFRTTLALFDELAASKDERFRNAMDAGMASLLNLRSAEATGQFQIALALKPGNNRATVGLRRAEKLPQVIAYMEDGKQHERSGDLTAALQAFRAALALDEAFAAAKQNAERVQALVTERDYRKSISRVLAALDNRNYREASRALEDAQKARRTAPEIRELKQRIQAEQQLAAISTLKKQANADERQEHWKSAIKMYEKILVIDSSITAAVQGKTRATKFSLLNDQIERYLNQPDRLNSPEPLVHARRVLAAADAVSEAGPKLQTKRDRLRRLVVNADTPRSVLLKSDGNTNVTLYRVAKFGSLTERKLSLRPGRYTAVGSRPGYRDVRVEFSVLSSDDTTIIVIMCKERI